MKDIFTTVYNCVNFKHHAILMANCHLKLEPQMDIKKQASTNILIRIDL